MKRWIVPVVAVVVVFGLWIATLCIVRSAWVAESAATATQPDTLGRLSGLGVSGDTFGAVNALFTGLALIGLVVTLAFQRIDMESTNQAQKEAAKAQKGTARVQRLQALVTANAEMLRAWPEVQEAVKAGRPRGPEQFKVPVIKDQKVEDDEMAKRKDVILASLRAYLEQLEQFNRNEEAKG